MSSTHVTRSELFAANKRAFDDVFGDPSAQPEPFIGQYQTLKGRGAIAAMKNNFDEGRATRNPASPTLMDFFCDVENLLTRNLTPAEQDQFTETYLFESPHGFTTHERMEIEQRLGRLLRARKISPVSRYFKTVRKTVNQPKTSRRTHGN